MVDRVGRPVVAFAMEWMPQYRLSFYDALSTELNRRDIDMRVFHGDAAPNRKGRHDAVKPEWARYRPNRRVRLGGATLTWQPVWNDIRTSDLVVLQQESALLLNYRALAGRSTSGSRVALWGHGQNPNPMTRIEAGERLKLWLTRKADWFFAYTDRSAELAAQTGLSCDRITAVNNSQAPPDHDAQAVSPEVADLVDLVSSRSRNIGWFTSALDDYKRLPFLIDVLDATRLRLPDFEFFVLGRGALEDVVFDAASSRPWLHALGARTGADKARVGEVARVTVHPGLIGLHVVDAFCHQAPVVTPRLDYHSHEVDYLDATNAILLEADVDPAAYADAVVSVLTDGGLGDRLASGCAVAATQFSLENMVQRFASGVEAALDLPAVAWAA